jgi:hypothetical protein
MTCTYRAPVPFEFITGAESIGTLRRAGRASSQRIVHARDDFVDGDLAITIGITSETRRHVRVAEGDVHHLDEFVDGNLAIAVAVAETRLGSRHCCQRYWNGRWDG